MVKILRDVQMQLAQMKTKWSEQALDAGQYIDQLSKRSNQCYEQQKANLRKGIWVQAGLLALGGLAGATPCFSALSTGQGVINALKQFSGENAKTTIELGGRVAELVKAYFIETSNIDCQAIQEQVRIETQDWNNIGAARQTNNQNMQSTIQQLVQMEQEAKMH